MTDLDILNLLKIDLQISSAAYDTFLLKTIEQAEEALSVYPFEIDKSSVNDCMIVRAYAAYLYRSRRGEDKAMPRSLQLLINNKAMHFNEESGGE